MTRPKMEFKIAPYRIMRVHGGPGGGLPYIWIGQRGPHGIECFGLLSKRRMRSLRDALNYALGDDASEANDASDA